MIHQPLGGAQGQATEIKIAAEHILKLREKLNRILAKNTNQELKTIESDTERDNFMDSNEALEYGIIDKNRITIIYKDKFSISFDNVKGIGYFVEIKNISDCDDIKTKIKEIYELLGELNIDIKYIDTKRYFDYL